MIKEYYQITLSEGNKTIKKYPKRICHSFLKQFSQMLLHQIGNIYLTMTDSSNTARTFTGAWYGSAYAALGATTGGLVVGTGSSAETVSDYSLGTLIAHGTGAGQLQYSAQIVGAPTWDATSNYFVFTRVFTNGSGGNITVNEIGLYFLGAIAPTNTFCFMRDVLPSGVTVTNGQALTLNYTIKATV